MAKELYVGHLPYEITNEELKKIFSVAGTVTSVHIITDPVTGKSKGCGYVRMASEEQLYEAIECLDDALIGTMQITVSIANPQKTTPKTSGSSGNNMKPGSRRFRAKRRES